MDFLKISLWLLTTIVSVHSNSRSHTGSVKYPYYPFNYEKPVHMRDCFCFNNQKDTKRVPEVINPDGLIFERLVYYVYKESLSGRVTLYIPNREKQMQIPDLSFEERDIIIDNPSDFIHRFDDLKVIKNIYNDKNNTNEPIEYTIMTISTGESSTKTEAPSTITDGSNVTNENPTATTEKPTVTTKSTFSTEEPTISTDKHTVSTEEPATVINAGTVIIYEKTVTNEIRTTDKPTANRDGDTKIINDPSEISEKSTGTTNESTAIIEEGTTANVTRTTNMVIIINNGPTGTIEGEKSTDATEKATTIPNEPSATTEKSTDIPKKPTGAPNEPTVTIEEETIANEIRTTTTGEPTGTTEGATTITDEPSATTKKPTDITEKPTGGTNEPTVIIEVETTANVIRTTTTGKPTGTSEGATTITDEPFATTEKPTKTTVSTFITKEPTTAHTPEITIINEETTATTIVSSTEEPITTVLKNQLPLQTAVTIEVAPVTPEETTFTTKETTTQEPSMTKSPKPTLTTAKPTTSEEPSPVIMLPLPDDNSASGKVFSLKDLYKIIQFVQKKKNEPNVDIWEQIIRGLKLNKSQVNKTIDYERDGSEYERNSLTFDLWFQQQLDGFSESDNFISLSEIKKYVRNILLDNGMIVTMEGLLKDLQGTILDLRDLTLRPILIGKPLNIGKIFEHRDQKSDFLIPSDSPYMQAIVVTLSNPSMILGIIPLGKTTIKKNVRESVTGPPPESDMIQEWVQNGKQYDRSGNKRKGNVWFNIKNRPNLTVGRKDLYSVPTQTKISKHKYFEKPENSETVITFKSPNDRYKVKSSRFVKFLGNDHSNHGALQNQLFMDKNKFASGKDLLTAWRNGGIVQTGEGQPLRLNVDSNKLETWKNLLDDKTRSEKDLLPAWKNNVDTQTDGELIPSLDVDDSINHDILDNQLIMDSKLIPENGLNTGWQHFSHGNVKLDPIELNSLNYKEVNGPISSEADEMLSSWKNRDKVHAGNRQVIRFNADNLSEVHALRNQILKNPNLFGKAGLKLLASMQRNKIIETGAGEKISYKGDNQKALDKLSKLIKDPTIFAKTAKKLYSALQRNGILQEGNGEAVKFKLNSPRQLEALRNQLLKHPKIFNRAAKQLLSVMEHNGIGLSDIAPVNNEAAATSLDESVPSAEKYLYTEEYFSPRKGGSDLVWTSEDPVGYYEEVEDDITGRIIGGSAATGSGAPLSMKGRMKDF